MERAFKFRIYPKLEQQILIGKTFGCSRLVFNNFLDHKINVYKTTGKSVSYNACSKVLTELKNEKLFLKEVDKFALQNTLKDLETAYKNFFIGKSAGFPKFKSKKNPKNSYKTNFTNKNIKVFEKQIQIPKLGLVKRKGYKNIPADKIISATISKSPTGKYFCSLIVDTQINKLPIAMDNIGIDLGIKDFATLSSYEVIQNPKTLSKYEDKLKRKQRLLSKKVKGSSNFRKEKLKLAKIHEKITNIRVDFLQKLSTKLINENQVICLEDLDIKNMLQNPNLAKSISDVSLNKFVTMLKYKAEWYGRTVIQVNRYFPSSQKCSSCDNINPLVKNLTIRNWKCPCCGATHNRDYNASVNILIEGLRLLKLSSVA